MTTLPELYLSSALLCNSAANRKKWYNEVRCLLVRDPYRSSWSPPHAQGCDPPDQMLLFSVHSQCLEPLCSPNDHDLAVCDAHSPEGIDTTH